jgi:hypothetical protein
MRSIRDARFAIVSSLTLVLTLSSSANQLTISTQEQLAQDTAQVPCKNSERLEAVRSLFSKLGAPVEDIVIEKRDGVENVIVRKPGQASGIIVVGAHYDKTRYGCGAVDNWTGIVALAHIYKTLKDFPTQKTLVFAAFGKEEEGLVGSRAMARSIKKEDLSQYCAMVNIDSLGMAAPQVLENISSKTLVKRVADLAQRMKIPFATATVSVAQSDSVSFIEKKVPAVTIHALSDDWRRVLHTGNDQVTKVNPISVYLAFRLSLALVIELDGLPCEASRGESNPK